MDRAPFHSPDGRSYCAAVITAVTGSMRLGSLFLTLPTRALTGQKRLQLRNIRRLFAKPHRPRVGLEDHWHPVCNSAHSPFGTVVMIVKLRTRSPAGERQVSHRPAIPISRRSVNAIA